MTETRPTSFRLPPGTVRRLDALAERYGLSRSALIAAAVDYLAEHPPAAGKVVAAALPPEVADALAPRSGRSGPSRPAPSTPASASRHVLGPADPGDLRQ